MAKIREKTCAQKNAKSLTFSVKYGNTKLDSTTLARRQIMGLLYVVLAIAAFWGLRFLARRYPLWNISLQTLRFSDTAGTVYTVENEDTATLTLSTGEHGWLYAVKKVSLLEAIQLGQCSAGMLERLPKVGDSFTLAQLDYWPKGYRYYPMVPISCTPAMTAK